MTQIDEPNLDKQIDKALEELVYCGRDTVGVTDEAVLARKAIKALIATQVAKAVDKTLTDLEDFKQEVLESRGIPNPTYVGKKELQEWIDNRRATLNGVKNK